MGQLDSKDTMESNPTGRKLATIYGDAFRAEGFSVHLHAKSVGEDVTLMMSVPVLIAATSA